MGNKKFNVIYADPPWSYVNKKTGRTDGDQPEGSGADTKYSTMTNEDIIAMGGPLSKITEKNAICFMWITVPLLPEGLQVLSAWVINIKQCLHGERL